jgi:hypothetical protein
MKRTLRFGAVLLSAFAILASAIDCAEAQAPSGKLSGGSMQNQGGGAGVGAGGAGGSGGNSTAFFDSQMLAYGAINEIAFAISHSVCEGPNALPPGANVVIYDQTSFQNLQAWQALKAAIKTLEAEYQTLSDTIDAIAPPAKAEVPPIAPTTPAAAGSAFFAGSDVSGLISALGASTVNTATTFTIPDSTIAVALIHQFSRHDQFVHASPCFTPGQFKVSYFPLVGNASAQDTKFVTDLFANLNFQRTKIQRYLATRPQPAPSSVPQSQPQTGVPQVSGQTPGQTTPVDPLTSAFTDLNTQYDAIVATLTTSVSQNQTPTATGSPVGVTSIVDGARVEVAMEDLNTYILYADIVAAGGIQKDFKNFITILLTGDWIRYSGGAIVNYGLIKADGTVVAADVLRYRTPYTHLWDSHEFEDLESTDSQDNLLTLCNHEAQAPWPGGARNTVKCNLLEPLGKRTRVAVDKPPPAAPTTPAVPPPGAETGGIAPAPAVRVAPPPGATPVAPVAPGAPVVPVPPPKASPLPPSKKPVAKSNTELDCRLMSAQKTTWAEFYLNVEKGELTYGGQIQNVTINTNNNHQYGFLGRAWGNTLNNPSFSEYGFNGTISRSTGDLFINGSWGGPTVASSISGKCSRVAAPKF